MEATFVNQRVCHAVTDAVAQSRARDVHVAHGVSPPRLSGAHFRERQEVNKAVRDTVHQQGVARRYECLRCHRTFRVYPRGVTKAQVSLRVKGLAVMFYLLGLSYGAVSLVLEALGVYLCKSRV